MRLLQSEEPRSIRMFLKSSMRIGSMGFDTIWLPPFLNWLEVDVVLKSCEPPVVVITLCAPLPLYALPGTLKSEECVNWPKESVPEDIIAYFCALAPLLPARNYPAPRESRELVLMLVPYLVLPTLLIESKSFLSIICLIFSNYFSFVTHVLRIASSSRWEPRLFLSVKMPIFAMLRTSKAPSLSIMATARTNRSMSRNYLMRGPSFSIRVL